MKREMIEKVVKTMMKYEGVQVELLGLTEDERAEELAEFIQKDIENTELKTLLEGLKLAIENDIAYVVEDGVRREATLEDKLELIESEWALLKANLLEIFRVDLYDEEVSAK